MAKRIGIIGAGPSGLTAIKSCLDEGLDPVCIERTDHIGGLWSFTEEVRRGQSCVMRSTNINVSKERMCYSDFPMPKEYPVFTHNTYVKQYLRLYAEHFGLLKHITFNTEVTEVKRADDFNQTGRWQVQLRNENGHNKTEYFDAILICTGHHADVNMPTFQGQETFKGGIIHSHDYRDARGYEGKRIVVVGSGDSGCDMAVELCRVAKVYVSTRRGTWVMSRAKDGGLPRDMMLRFSRLWNAFESYLPRAVMEGLSERMINQRFDHGKFSLKPGHGFYSQQPTINDELPIMISRGAITIKANIKRITERGVEFEDGTFEDDIDVIVFATGYRFGFPFLDKSITEVKNNRVELFKYIFPPELCKQTLAIIGCVQPLGGLLPVSELQCRLATQVFQGITILPKRSDMWKDIREKEEAVEKIYGTSQRHTIEVNQLSYLDELATLAGCKPDIKSMFLKDPKLAWECLTGPSTAYQFRLTGRNPWSGARNAILTQWERTLYPLKTRPVVSESYHKARRLMVVAALLLAFLVRLIWAKVI